MALGLANKSIAVIKIKNSRRLYGRLNIESAELIMHDLKLMRMQKAEIVRHNVDIFGALKV